MRRHLCAGAYGSRHMGCMGGPARRLAEYTSGGLRVSVTPQRVNTFGAQRSDRLTLLHMFCTCPPLCAGALWPMPAWVWRDVRSGFFPCS